MPAAAAAAAGDGLQGDPAEEAARAAGDATFLPAWVCGVPRERLRDFQHHKRVGNYLVGSRKLGEGSFAKVREGLHVLTGEKVSPPRNPHTCLAAWYFLRGAMGALAGGCGSHLHCELQFPSPLVTSPASPEQLWGKACLSASHLQDKKPKEQEKRGDLLHRPLSKKLDKSLPAHKQPAATSLLTQLQNTKALLRERRAPRSGLPDKDPFGCRNLFRKTSDSSCVASSSMEFIPALPPRTPRITKKPETLPQDSGSTAGAPPKDEPPLLDMVRSFESADHTDLLSSPIHHYRMLGSPGGLAPRHPSGERTLSVGLLPASPPPPLQTSLHPTLASFAHDEAKSSGLPREEGLGSPPPGPSQPLGSPSCVKSRGRFPMMGIGQMLRKRHQGLLSCPDAPPLPTPTPSTLPLDLKGQC
ncbi:hormonally up-regulated neu tumor-associated kinase [Erinaceus europaeus]|uniref:Hormonally up-regulated neu tumor-associated kinase n=1 Tax=Erinaceus europaeus TaxID=9365 RepID=A0ABM3XWB0_ERIEU|nr:hormonally up-regulated neu tumor-associated kinase [Erinaceus europaeus]